MFNSTHPLLGTYLKIFSRKTKKETKKGEHQAKKWGLMAKKIIGPWMETEKVQKCDQCRRSRRTPRKNKYFLKLALFLVS